MSIKDSELLRAVAEFSFISIEIVVLTAGLVALGYWGHQKYAWPQGVITFLGFFGFALALFRIWRRLESQDRKKGP